MNIPKRHHMIPRVYLENFVEADGRLTVSSKRRNRIFRPRPIDALIRGHYYSQPEDGVVNKNQRIETDFLGGIETFFPSFMSQVLAGNKNFDQKLFVNTVFSMRVRSPAFRECFELALADLVDKRRADLKPYLPPAPVGYEEYFEDIGVAIDPHRSITAMAYYVKFYCSPILQMEWSVRSAPKGYSFLTSDNPVIWFERDSKGIFPTIYPKKISARVRAIFPLSPRTILVGRPSMSGAFSFLGWGEELTRKQSNEANMLQIGCSWDEYIGAHRLPKLQFDTISKLAPRMEISDFNPDTNAFFLSKSHLSPLREKLKFNGVR